MNGPLGTRLLLGGAVQCLAFGTANNCTIISANLSTSSKPELHSLSLWIERWSRKRTVLLPGCPSSQLVPHFQDTTFISTPINFCFFPIGWLKCRWFSSCKTDRELYRDINPDRKGVCLHVWLAIWGNRGGVLNSKHVGWSLHMHFSFPGFLSLPLSG